MLANTPSQPEANLASSAVAHRQDNGWGSCAWIGPLLVVATAAGMIWKTWLTWPDPILDFGRELYIPWQLTEGQLLYRDMVVFNGPLSPYINALWFTLFGVSLRTLVWANLAILAALLCLIYRMVIEVASRGSATLACLVFLTLFAFNQYTAFGNMNWMCPYSHEMTHGVSLSILMIYGQWWFLRRGWMLAGVGSGFFLGLVMLTKVEVSAAAAAAFGVGSALALARIETTGRRVTAAVALLGAVLLGPAIAWGLLSAGMPAGDALRGVLGSWHHLLNSDHTGLFYFQWSTGLDRPGENGLELLIWSGIYTSVITTAVMLSLARNWRWRVAAGLPVGAMVVAFLVWNDASSVEWTRLVFGMDWDHLASPLPLAAAVVCVVMLARMLRSLNLATKVRAGCCLIAAVYAFGLLLKMILNARIFHYGFALAMPAAIVVLVALWNGGAAWLRQRGGRIVIYRAVMLAMWIVIVLAHLWLSDRIIDNKSNVVGTGGDRFIAGPRGQVVNETLKRLTQFAKPQETFLVLPEGEILNFLSRRRNPIRYGNFNPASVVLYGEDQMRAELRAHPPNVIVVAHVDYSSYAHRFFGRDYGRSIFQWLLENYEPVDRVGAPVGNVENRPGMVVFRRLPTHAAAVR